MAARLARTLALPISELKPIPKSWLKKHDYNV
jgi:hypothetical protein